jgi:hypothetical protein
MDNNILAPCCYSREGKGMENSFLQGSRSKSLHLLVHLLFCEFDPLNRAYWMEIMCTGLDTMEAISLNNAIDRVREQLAKANPIITSSHVRTAEKTEEGDDTDHMEPYSQAHIIMQHDDKTGCIASCKYEWVIGIIVKFYTFDLDAEQLLRLHKPNPLTLPINIAVRRNACLLVVRVDNGSSA